MKIEMVRFTSEATLAATLNGVEWQGIIIKKNLNGDIEIVSDNEIAQEASKWLKAGNKPAPYMPPPPFVPQSVSRWQFITQGMSDGMMSAAEGIAIGQSGAIPAKFALAVSSLPQSQQDQIKVMLLTVTSVMRDNTFVNGIIGPVMGWNASRLDQFFIDAAKRT